MDSVFLWRILTTRPDQNIHAEAHGLLQPLGVAIMLPKLDGDVALPSSIDMSCGTVAHQDINKTRSSEERMPDLKF